MYKPILHVLIFLVASQVLNAQAILQADGPGNTYELINSVLAPGNNVVEVPDCGHTSFGRHIDEVMDSELNQFVFRFQIHTTPDNDRCQNFDRQRNEIKTYGGSPDSLLAVRFEEVKYTWKFKIDTDFQPSSSFTHLHQIKAVGGSEAAMPLITLTARKGSPDRLELRYAESLSQSTIAQTDLMPLKGVWIQAEETILYDEVGLGQYAIQLSRLSDGLVLFSYSNNSIRTWKTNASFLRPKWGIYRSLNDASSLRDESVYFTDFTIRELDPIVSVASPLPGDEELLVYPNPTSGYFQLSGPEHQLHDLRILNTLGQDVTHQVSLQKISDRKTRVQTKDLPNGFYSVFLHQKVLKVYVSQTP